MLLSLAILGALLSPQDNQVEETPTLPVVNKINYYYFDEDIFTFDFINETQQKIEEEKKIREEQERLEAIRVAEEIAREQEQQRIASVTFDPYNLSKPSNLTGDEMYNLLKDTGLKDVAYTYIQAEKEYGVNAFFLAGLSALESGWGTSSRAVNDNNLTGYNIQSDGDRYSFSSRSESLMRTAKLISQDYLDQNGRYYFGDSIWDVNKNYCPPVPGEELSWGDKILNISNNLYREYRNTLK